jgi:hypothetical protein
MVDKVKVASLEVGYLSERDVKLFKGLGKGKMKRKLRAGQPFGVQLIFYELDPDKPVALDNDRKIEVVQAVKAHFDGLEDRDIYVVQIEKGKKRILGRGIDLGPPR